MDFIRKSGAAMHHSAERGLRNAGFPDVFRIIGKATVYRIGYCDRDTDLKESEVNAYGYDQMHQLR